MSIRTIVSFERVEFLSKGSPSKDALVDAFHSCVKGNSPKDSERYRAAACHFLYWIEKQGIAMSAIDDTVVMRFEKHRCRCQGFSRHKHNRPLFINKVRRFVRFLEDQGFVDIPDDINDLNRHMVDYAAFLAQRHYDASTIGKFQTQATHFSAWVRISRLRWADLTEDHVNQYVEHVCRCPVSRKRGKLTDFGRQLEPDSKVFQT